MTYLNTIKENKWIIAILAIAAALRIYHLDFQSVWMDEIYTMNVANPKESFGILISEVNMREGFPYLYFITLKVLFSIFGHTAVVARLFSVLFGLLGIYFLYRLGGKLYDRKVGLYAAAIAAFSEYCIYASQDARPYTLYFCAILISYLALIRFLKDNTIRNAVVYGLAAGLVFNVSLFAFLSVFAQFVLILFFLTQANKAERIALFKNAAVSGVIAVLMFLPNILILLRMLGVHNDWIPISEDSMGLIFKEFLGNSEMTLIFFSSLFIFYLINLFHVDEERSTESLFSNKLLFSFLLFFSWAVIFILVLFYKSFVDRSLFVSRYFISLLPVFFLVFAIALRLIGNRIIRYSIFSVLLLLMFLNLTIVKKYYKTPNKAQFRDAAAFVETNNKKHEPVYTSLKYWFNLFLPDSKFDITEKPSIEALINEMMQDPSKVKPFWYIDAHGRTFVLSEAAQNFVNTTFYVENNYQGFDAWGKHFILLKDVPKVIDISKFKNLQQYNGDSFTFNIEAFDYSNNVVNASGWAYFPDQPATASNVDVVLIKDGKAERLNTQKVSRADVTSYFKSNFDLSNSGFNATLNTSGLQKGSYTLAIYLLNKETKKEGLILTDKKVEVK